MSVLVSSDMWDASIGVCNLYVPPCYLCVLVRWSEREFLTVMTFFFLENSLFNCAFFIRELLHTKRRQEETIEYLTAALGDTVISCEIDLAGPQLTACSQGAPFLPSEITEDIFSLELPNGRPNGFLSSNPVSVTMDNTLSRSHTLVRILCQDHKGLIYDIMRTLKDYNIQVHHKSILRITFSYQSFLFFFVLFKDFLVGLLQWKTLL